MILDANSAYSVVADFDITFAEAGITSVNTRAIYKVYENLLSYIPGRPINQITAFEAGVGYYIITGQQSLDLTGIVRNGNKVNINFYTGATTDWYYDSEMAEWPTADMTLWVKDAIAGIPYTNLLLSDGSASPGISFTAAEIQNPFLYLVYQQSADAWTKKVSSIDLSSKTDNAVFNYIGLTTKNWFTDPSCVNGSYVRNDNLLFGSSVSFKRTTWISVKPGDIIKYSGDGTAAISRVTAYSTATESGFISGGRLITAQAGQLTDVQVTIPAGCYFIIASALTTGTLKLETPSGKIVDANQAANINLYRKIADELVKSFADDYPRQQLYNRDNQIITPLTFPITSGYVLDGYISNADGLLKSATGYKAAIIPIDAIQANLSGSGILVGQKYYAFWDASGAVLQFGNSWQATSATIAIPAGAAYFATTLKRPTDAAGTGNQFMLVYGTVVASFFPYNISVMNGSGFSASSLVAGNSVPTPTQPQNAVNKAYVDAGKRATTQTLALLGDSLVANNTNPSYGGGWLAAIKQVIQFSVEPTVYGYPGRTISTGAAGSSILDERASLVAHDMMLWLFTTNDFRLNKALGTEADYLAADGTNISQAATVYGAIGYLVKYVYNLNPQCKIILMTPPQRDTVDPDDGNFPYNSWEPNKIGNTMTDYCDAIRFAAKRESLPLVDLFEEGGFNFNNLDEYTFDRLHYNTLGGQVLGRPIRAKLLELI